MKPHNPIGHSKLQALTTCFCIRQNLIILFKESFYKEIFKYTFLLTFFLRTLAFANNNSVVSVSELVFLLNLKTV